MTDATHAAASPEHRAGGDVAAKREGSRIVAAPVGPAQSPALRDRDTGFAAGRAAVTGPGLLGLQRLAGNQAVASWVRPIPSPDVVLQRVPLEDGPPLAPGNYRYGQIASTRPPCARPCPRWPVAMAWQQTVKVEPTIANRAEDAQAQITTQAGAVQTQFQQSLLNSVRELLANSEKKLQAEGRRYGFPDDESIFRPKAVSAGASAIMPSMPGSDDLRGVMASGAANAGKGASGPAASIALVKAKDEVRRELAEQLRFGHPRGPDQGGRRVARSRDRRARGRARRAGVRRARLDV